MNWMEYGYLNRVSSSFITQSGAFYLHISVMVVTLFRPGTGSGLIFLSGHLTLCLAHGMLNKSVALHSAAHSYQKDSCSPFEIRNSILCAYHL